MQAQPVIELQNLVALDRNFRPQVVILWIGIGHDSVQSVVAAFQLDEYQQVAIRGTLRHRCPRQARRFKIGEREAADTYSLQKIATLHRVLLKSDSWANMRYGLLELVRRIERQRAYHRETRRPRRKRRHRRQRQNRMLDRQRDV